LDDEGEIQINIDQSSEVLTHDVDHIDVSGSSIVDVVTGMNNDLNSGDTVSGNDQTKVAVGFDDSDGFILAKSNFSGFKFTNVNEFSVTNDRVVGGMEDGNHVNFDMSSSDHVEEYSVTNSKSDVVFEHAQGKEDPLDPGEDAELTLNILSPTEPANVTLEIQDSDVAGTDDLVNVHVTDSRASAYEAKTVTIDLDVENIDFTTTGANQQIDIEHFVAEGATGDTAFVAHSKQNVNIDTLTLKSGAIPANTAAPITVADFTDVTDGAHVEIGMDNSMTALGSEGADIFDGLNDNGYEVFGNGGKDTITTKGGNDYLHGGDDIDTINFGAGADHVWGDAGNDIINDNADDLTISDIINGGDGIDTLNVGWQNTIQKSILDNVTKVETINLTANDDYKIAIGDNSAFANDHGTYVTVNGWDANSVELDAREVEGRGITLIGSTGNDILEGSDQNDIFDARRGDFSSSNVGDDTFNGYKGDDVFKVDGSYKFDKNDSFDGGQGTDSIEIYNDDVDGNEKIELGSGIWSVEEVNVISSPSDNGSVEVKFDAGYTQSAITINAGMMPASETLYVKAQANGVGEDITVNGSQGYNKIQVAVTTSY